MSMRKQRERVIFAQPIGDYLRKVFHEVNLSRAEVSRLVGMPTFKVNRLLDEPYREDMLTATDFMRLARLLCDVQRLPVEWCLARLAEGIGENMHKSRYEQRVMTPVVDPFRRGRPK